jgi:predicted nucleic acid-binding protein
MSRVIIDSNVLVALLDKKDVWHKRASAILKAVNELGGDLIFLDCVLNETISVLGRRAEEKRRSSDFPLLLDSLIGLVPPEDITWISLEIKQTYESVVGMVRDYKGILSFHDALMALFAQRNSIPYLLSFDEDFDGVPWFKRMSEERDVKGELSRDVEE